MKKITGILVTILASVPSLASQTPGASCDVILRKTTAGNTHAPKVVADAKVFNDLVREELEKKHYRIVEQTAPIKDGDIVVESYLDYGVEPYFPLLKSCVADIRILQTIRSGWETRTLFQKEYSKQRMSAIPVNCLKKASRIIEKIPDC